MAIGAPASIVEVSGNVKFDYRPDVAPLEIAPKLEQLIAGRKVLILGSTMEGEDELLLPLVERFLAEENAFVIVAPRKAERFEVVAGLLATTNLRFARRTELEAAESADLLLLDSFGELARSYRYATAAFVGGTLAPFGGHNPIEPAAAGVAVCFGKSMSNFREIAEIFLRDDAAAEVASAEEVFAFARRMFHDDAARQALGERAKATVLRNRGASERTARAIIGLLP